MAMAEKATAIIVISILFTLFTFLSSLFTIHYTLFTSEAPQKSFVIS